jgi:hypothetical protein
VGECLEGLKHGGPGQLCKQTIEKNYKILDSLYAGLVRLKRMLPDAKRRF